MADAPVADAAKEAETPPAEEPLSEDEICIDRGSFENQHGFPAAGTRKVGEMMGRGRNEDQEVSIAGGEPRVPRRTLRRNRTFRS